jgi:hypothetical protein
MHWTIVQLVRFKEKVIFKIICFGTPSAGNNSDSLNCLSGFKGMPVKLVLAEVYKDLREDAKALELVNEGDV